MKSNGLQYNGGSLENRMWSLLISISWLLNNLKMKSENVHCQNIVHSHGAMPPTSSQTKSQGYARPAANSVEINTVGSTLCFSGSVSTSVHLSLIYYF